MGSMGLTFWLGFTLEYSFILKQCIWTWLGPPHLDKDMFHHLLTTARILKSEQLRISKYICPCTFMTESNSIWPCIYHRRPVPNTHVHEGGPCDFLTVNDITQYAFFGNLLLITKYLKCCSMYLCKCVSICRCTRTGELPVESIRERWTPRCWSYRQSWAALCGCWETNSSP